MNMTEKRLQVLRAVRDCPGIYAGTLTDRVFPRTRSNGSNIGWTAQGATRFGCGYAAPLVAAGLLQIDRRVTAGGARYFLTPKGLQAIAEKEALPWPFPREAKS